MAEWIDELAAAFELDPLSGHETDALLGIAREVAHRVERKGTPLATFLLGMHVARSTTEGSARPEALDAAIAELRGRLPPAGPQP